MSVKSDVLLKLEENKGSFFSGEELAVSLGVSRTAVWKAIKQLETEGYAIEAVPNKGYCLSDYSDVMSVEGIKAALPDRLKNIELTVLKTTGSTNTDAKQAIAAGCTHGTTFVAEKQTSGRGRRGRSFLSFEGSGIYMSVVIKPEVNVDNIVYVTTAVSVAVARAISRVAGIETEIKWVNDIYFKGKKICGILTEAVTDCESGIIDSLVVGMGVNFSSRPEDIPDELKDTAGSLFEGEKCSISRNLLAAEIINQVLIVCDDLKEHTFIEEYKRRSMIIGQKINVIKNDGSKKAVAEAVDDRGGLVVCYEDGTKETLNTGEVTIRRL